MGTWRSGDCGRVDLVNLVLHIAYQIPSLILSYEIFSIQTPRHGLYPKINGTNYQTMFTQKSHQVVCQQQ